MTEIQVAKRIIKRLQLQVLKATAENQYLKKDISATEYDEINSIEIKNEKFKDKELTQMIHTLMKLTGKYDLTAKEVSSLIGVDYSDVDRVYNNINSIFEQIN